MSGLHNGIGTVTANSASEYMDAQRSHRHPQRSAVCTQSQWRAIPEGVVRSRLLDSELETWWEVPWQGFLANCYRCSSNSEEKICRTIRRGMGDSVVSQSQGGVAYDSLRTDTVSGYTFNMVKLPPGSSVEDQVHRLHDHVLWLLRDLDSDVEDGRHVERVVVGKTSCPARSGVTIDAEKVTNAWNWRAGDGPGNR